MRFPHVFFLLGAILLGDAAAQPNASGIPPQKSAAVTETPVKPPAVKAPAAQKRDASLAQITDEPGLPRVLIIGDSISMGYTLPVRELLKGRANVHRIPENGGDTGHGLTRLKDWLGGGKWDVIHFNWGLHDLKHWKDNKLDMAGPQVNPIEQYEKNLRDLVTQLKATGARLIWASTTPVPEESAGRVAHDEEKYNEAAARVMKDNGVTIDDLHALVVPRQTELQLPKNVHFSEKGSRALAEQVASSIEAQLKK